jgi:hypothetical protein
MRSKLFNSYHCLCQSPARDVHMPGISYYGAPALLPFRVSLNEKLATTGSIFICPRPVLKYDAYTACQKETTGIKPTAPPSTLKPSFGRRRQDARAHGRLGIQARLPRPHLPQIHLRRLRGKTRLVTNENPRLPRTPSRQQGAEQSRFAELARAVHARVDP